MHHQLFRRQRKSWSLSAPIQCYRTYHEAAKTFSMAEMKPLLRAAAEREEPWPRQTNLPPEEQTWWENWNRGLQMDNWTEAKNLLTFRNGPFTDVELGAYWILAEKHMDKAKNMPAGNLDEQRIRRSYVAGILRDCRMQNIQIDSKYVD